MRSSKARQAPVAGNTFCIAGKFYWNLCNNGEELILYLGLASEVSYLNFESNFVSSSPCSWPDLGLLIQLQITDYTSLPPFTWHSAHWTLLNVTFKLQIRFKRMNLKLKPTAIIHHKNLWWSALFWSDTGCHLVVLVFSVNLRPDLNS